MMRAALRLAVQRWGLSESVSIPVVSGELVVLDLLMAKGSGLKLGGEFRKGAATTKKLRDGFAAVWSCYARRDLRCAFPELLRGVDVCLILDTFGALITCPIQEGDGAQPRRFSGWN